MSVLPTNPRQFLHTFRWGIPPAEWWHRALRYAYARFKAVCHIAYFRLRGFRFECGPRLRIFGWLRLHGPGKVVFGADVVIYGTVTPWTHAPEATISVGDSVVLRGTRFGCARRIAIERDCMLADARIMDTDFHSIRADRRNPSAPVRVAPIHLAENVWVGTAAALLPGTTIDRNSVVALGAVCMGKYPADKVILGNPAKAVMPIPLADPPSASAD